MRAVIYARYSTDKQSENSLADQYAHCERRASADGLQIVQRWGDEATSGSTLVESRPQGRLLMASARERRFDVLLLEGLDRLSRDRVEIETVLRRFEHWGLRVIGVSDGYDSAQKARKVTRAVRGIVNELYLDDLSEKTHRGLTGQVHRGMSAGGVSFGYRSVKGEHGSAIEVDDQSAAWVRHIFNEFAKGRSIQSIAHELNRAGVPSPRGRGWGVSVIYGSPNKGAGILNNELYVGRYIWNRSQWLKHPDTRKRERLVRPRNEWIVVDRPDLRIVDDSAWRAVRARIDAKDLKPSKGRGRPARTLFGGQLCCPGCGGAIIAVNARTYGCGRRKDQGPTACGNGSAVRRSIIDSRLMDVVREEVLSEAAMRRFEHELRAGLIAELSASEEGRKRNADQVRLAELESEIKRLVDAVVQVGISEALSVRLRDAEAEKQTLQAASREPHRRVNIEETVRAVMQNSREVVTAMETALKSDIERARASLRQLLGRITISVDSDGTVWADLENKTARTPLGDGLSLNVVAGAGFEPTTFGL